MFRVVDVEQAAASVEADRVRILEEIRRGVGFRAVNTLARGAIESGRCMYEPEVLQAVAGHTGPLAALQGREALSKALIAAASGGLMAPLRMLLARRGEVEVNATNEERQGWTALHTASGAGHLEAVALLLKARAQPVPCHLGR